MSQPNPTAQMICGDALEEMAKLEAQSVHLIATDPPYFRVKSNDWDHQWDSRADFVAWMGELCAQWARVLKPNGSLYVFASPQMAAHVEVEIAESFNVLNSIVWRKSSTAQGNSGPWNRMDADTLRSYFPQREQIIFAEPFGSEWNAKCDDLRGFVFEPIRAYLAGEFQRAGVRFEKANEFCGTANMAGHYFSRSQWALPTAEHYASLQRGLNALASGAGVGSTAEYLRRDYEALRRDYEALRRDYEALRRPFALQDAAAPFTDVWDFVTVAGHKDKHVCEKPFALMSHIIQTSSKPGDLVLDCFAGSGVTGQAALSLGRSFVGIERDPHWHAEATHRISRHAEATSNAPTLKQATSEPLGGLFAGI